MRDRITTGGLALAALLLLAVGCGADPEGDGTASRSEALRSRPDVWVPCSYGQQIDSFWNVPVYCDDPREQGHWQCDELADRFAQLALHEPAIDNYITEFAKAMCGDADKMVGSYTVWGPNFRNTYGQKPQAGDFLVWTDPGTGHTAVVTGSDASNIYYVQQNWSQRRNGVDGALVRAHAAWYPWSSFFGALAGNYLQPECWIRSVEPTGNADGGTHG